MPAQTQAIPQSTALDRRPYAPSWVDRLMNWVGALPGPFWLYYLGATILLLLIGAVVKWWDGSLPVGTYTRFGAVVSTTRR